MVKIFNGFDGEKFAAKHQLSSHDFHQAGDELVCPSLPDLTEADIADCIATPPEQKTAERFILPVIAPDFIVQSPKPKKDHLEAHARAVEISQMTDKSIAEIVLNLVVYITELEKRLAKKNI